MNRNKDLDYSVRTPKQRLITFGYVVVLNKMGAADEIWTSRWWDDRVFI